MNSEWRPLGLDSWRRNGGYPESLEQIDTQLDVFNSIGKKHCREMGAIALRSNLAHQTDRNGYKHTLIPEDDVRYDDAREGSIMPSDMIRLLHEYPDLKSAELARLTHVGVWDTNNMIDTPVRENLLEASDIDTQPESDESYYTFNSVYINHPNEVGIGRKRVVYSHFGGQVLTVITNNLLVDLSDKTSLDRTFRKKLHDYVRDRENFSFSDHHDFLRENLESQLRNPDCTTKSSGLIPLSTIYYGTLESARTKAKDRERNCKD